MPRIRDIFLQIELIPDCRPLPPLGVHQILTALSGVCALWLAFGALDIAQARPAHGDFKTAAERRAWSQIKQGEVADFNKHCGTPRLDPKNEEDKRWKSECRTPGPLFGGSADAAAVAGAGAIFGCPDHWRPDRRGR